MKQIRTNSYANTYNFLKGDVVFVINPTIDNAVNYYGESGKTLIRFLSSLNAAYNMGWEACVDFDGSIKAFVINNYKNNAVNEFSSAVKNGLNEIFVSNSGKFITDVYQLI